MAALGSPQDMIGAVLAGRYRLIACLGTGPVGAVFEAHDLDEGVACAVKTLRDGAYESAAVVDAFMRDTRAARNLVHPNIARCHDTALAEDGAPYRVMELLDGVPLGAHLTPGLAYEARRVLPIAVGVLAGLREAHDQNLVHGDLKPSNVFVMRHVTASPSVKVLDFGMAGVLRLRRRNADLDDAGAFESLDFLSPEQRFGAEAVAQDDLWALAVVLHRMLTGYAPVAHSGAREARGALSGTDLASLDHPLPAPWHAYFAKAFAHHPRDRFTSARAMERELAAVQTATREAAPPARLAPITEISSAGAALAAQLQPAEEVDPLARVRAAAAISLEATMPGADSPSPPRAPKPAPLITRKLVFFVIVTVVLAFAAGFAAGRF